MNIYISEGVTYTSLPGAMMVVRWNKTIQFRHVANIVNTSAQSE